MCRSNCSKVLRAANAFLQSKAPTIPFKLSHSCEFTFFGLVILRVCRSMCLSYFFVVIAALSVSFLLLCVRVSVFLYIFCIVIKYVPRITFNDMSRLFKQRDEHIFATM